MSTVGYEGDTDALADDAKGILAIVWSCYPGHDWHVTCKPGIIFIRDLSLGANWGMNIRVREFEHDAAVLKKKIVMLTGEWLERAGKKRGRKDGDQEIVRVEGLPEKWQPVMQPPKKLEVVSERLREEVRPQVAELLKNGN